MMTIISHDDGCVNIDACVKNKWNWHWLEKSVTVDGKKLLPSSAWNAGNLTFNVGESIRKV